MEPEKEVVETETTTEVVDPKDPSQDKPEYTDAEKAAHNLKKQADKAKELGLNPADILGIQPIKSDPDAPDDEPVTMGRLRELEISRSRESALKMADSIPDEKEREAVKKILQTRIVTSNDPVADFALARSSVNSDRHVRIAEELARKGTPGKAAPGGSAPAVVEEEFVPTPEEQVFMRHPYNMTREQILAKRKKA